MPDWQPSISPVLAVKLDEHSTGFRTSQVLLNRLLSCKLPGREAWLLALVFFWAYLIYWPGLSGDFFLDDYPHIVHNKAIQINQLDWSTVWAAANSTESGPLGRPVALASFALNHALTGLDPYFFKLANLILHLLTGLGVYFLLHAIALPLTRSRTSNYTALMTASLWLLHPLNVSTVLYAVQRMTILATMFTVWGLLCYCHGRSHLLKHQKSGLIWIFFGILLGGAGMYAKETAALMIGYMLTIEWLAFNFRMPTLRQSYLLKTLYALAIAVPLAWVLFTKLLAPGWLDSAYLQRAFTLPERLMTESRVLWDYLCLIFLPNIQAMGLYHDGYQISRGLINPPSTLFTIAAHTFLILSGWFLRKRWPLLLFAVLWFYIGHSAESTFLPLEIKYEHRNYLPMLGVLLLMAHLISTITSSFKNPTRARALLSGLVILTFSTATLVRAGQFGDFWKFSEMEAVHHPESSRANQAAAISLLKLMIEINKPVPELIAQSEEYLRRSARANPHSCAPLFTAILFLPRVSNASFPIELMFDLEYRLRYSLPDANINSYFLAVLHLAQEEKLRLGHQQIHQLFEAVEANPHFKTAMKADIMAIRAAYAQSVEHDNLKAKTLINRALATESGEANIYVPAVWIYQEAGLWQDAEKLLNTLKKLDHFGINRKSIEWLSKRQQKKSS